MTSTSAAAAAGGPYAIEFQDVGLTYRSEQRTTRALEGVVAAIEPGTVTAFVGPSGCGKSSLVKLAAGLLKPTAGSIKVNGTPVIEPRSDIGVAFQNPTMMPWRTVLQNVLISAEVSAHHRDAFRANAGAVSRPRPATCSRSSVCTASRTHGRGKCPAECSSAPRSAAR